MSNSFQPAISNEPPPLELSSDEDDSEEFRTPGLKLDVCSAEPSPLSTPRKTAKEDLPIHPPIYFSNDSPPAVGENGHDDRDNFDIPLPSSPPPFDEPLTNPTENEEEPVLTVEEKAITSITPQPQQQNDDDEDFKDCEVGFQDRDVPVVENLKNNQNEEEDVKVSSSPEEDDDTSKPFHSNDCDSSPDTSSSNSKNETETKSPEETKPDFINDKQEEDDEEFQDFSSTTIAPNQVTVQSAINPTALTETIENEGISEVTNTNAETESAIEDEEFCDFETSKPEIEETKNKPQEQFENPSNDEIEDNSKREEIQDAVEEDDDDDFGDFASTSFTSAPEPPPVVEKSAFSEEIPSNIADDDDDFADFQDFKEAEPSTSTQQAPPQINRKMSAEFSAALESKFENLIKTMIPPLSEEPSSLAPSTTMEIAEEEGSIGGSGDSDASQSRKFQILNKELSESKDSYWNHVLDFEDSNALLYKWLNCSYQQRLYRSLNIDTTTIVYTEKWGAIEVPRFAASMVDTPILQPQQVTSSSSSSRQMNDFSSSSANNGRSKPVDTDVNANADMQPIQRPISKEAQQILQKIPDISFMTSKTLVFPQAATSSRSSFLQ